MPPLSGYRTSFNTSCYSLQKTDAPGGLPFATYLILDQDPHPFVSMHGWQLEAEPGTWLDIFNHGPNAAQLNLVTGELWVPTWPKEGWLPEGVMQPDYLIRKPGEAPVHWASLSPTWWGMVRAQKHQYQVYQQLSAAPIAAPLNVKTLRLLTSAESRYGVYEAGKTGQYYISYVLPTEFYQEYLAGPYSAEELVTTGNRVFLKRTGIDAVLEDLAKKSKSPGRPRKLVEEGA